MTPKKLERCISYADLFDPKRQPTYVIPAHSGVRAIAVNVDDKTYTRHSTPTAARKYNPDAAVLFGDMPKSIILGDDLEAYRGRVSYVNHLTESLKRMDNSVFERMKTLLYKEKLPPSLVFEFAYGKPAQRWHRLDLHSKRITEMQILWMCCCPTWQMIDHSDGQRNMRVIRCLGEILLE